MYAKAASSMSDLILRADQKTHLSEKVWAWVMWPASVGEVTP